MSLVNEASYLYNLSKKLTKVHQKLKDATKDAKHHRTKHNKSTKDHHKRSHLGKYQKHVGNAKRLHKQQTKFYHENILPVSYNR